MVNRYRALVEHSADAMWMVGDSGRIEYASPASRAVLGYTSDELAGAGAFDFFLPSDREEARVLLFGPEGGSGTFRLRRKDGKTIWAHVTGGNRLADPEVAAVIVGLRDVTEPRRAEQALRDSESRFRALVEHSADGFALLDRNGTVVYCGPPVLGYTTFVGRSVLEAIHSDDLERICADLALVAARPDKPYRAQYRARHADGGTRWIEVLFTNLLRDAAVGGIVVNYRDITESREREIELRRTRDQLSHVLEGMREAFVALDRDWRFLFVNRRVAEDLGKDAAEVVGKVIWDLYPHLRDTAVYPNYRRVMNEGVPVQFEMRSARYNGRWFDIHAYPTEDGMAAYALDITDRKRAEQYAAVRIEVLEALLEAGTLAEFAPRVLRAVGENLGCASATFWTFEQGRWRASETWKVGKARRGKADDTLARKALERGGVVMEGTGVAFAIGQGAAMEWTCAEGIDVEAVPVLEAIARQIGKALGGRTGEEAEG
jgi:PAS domain S-box-containing protein